MEILAAATLVIGALAFGLTLIGYSARQWRKLKRGE